MTYTTQLLRVLQKSAMLSKGLPEGRWQSNAAELTLRMIAVSNN